MTLPMNKAIQTLMMGSGVLHRMQSFQGYCTFQKSPYINSKTAKLAVNVMSLVADLAGQWILYRQGNQYIDNPK